MISSLLRFRHYPVFLCLLFYLAPRLEAQKPQAHNKLELIPDNTVESVIVGNKRVEVATGFPIAWYALDFRTEGKSPEMRARSFIRAHAGELGIDSSLASVSHKATVKTPAGYHVRFRQLHQGFPVYWAELVINIDHDHIVYFVTNGFRHGLKLPEPKATLKVSSVQAQQSAKAYFALREEPRITRVETVVYQGSDRTRLAHRVRMIPANEPFGDWEILVDAASGEIFRVEDKACSFRSPMRTARKSTGVDGTGMVFDPDPLTRARATYGDAGFVDSNDQDLANLNAQRVQRDLRNLIMIANQVQLTGPYANIEDFESPRFGEFTQSSTVFDFTRSQPGFEAVNCYFHIDQSMRYINDTLEIEVMPFQYTGGVQVDPHGLNGLDNSHYLPTTGQLAFGEGGVDDAEDPDVILHELGHGLHDWLTVGGISQNDGLSEGAGDYWAKSYNRSLGFWQPSDPQYHWMFQWDGHNEFWNGRVTNYGATYPSGLVGQIHTDGQMWSSTLMSIHDEIGREPTDRNFLIALAMLNASSNQNDAAQAFVQADINLYGGDNIRSILFWFEKRGYTVTVPADPGTIQVTPAALSDSLETGQIASQILTIANIGSPGSVLNFSIRVTGAAVDATAVVSQLNPVGKMEESLRLIQGRGGPDQFGHVWIDSDDPEGPVFDWFDISLIGSQLFLGDDEAAEIALPFIFPFYGDLKNAVLVSSNGYLTFGSDGIDFDNDGIPNTATPNDLIAVFWDDLNPVAGGSIHYYHDNPNSRFVIQYTNIAAFGSSSEYTFQVFLREDGGIVLQYLDIQGTVSGATVGIENADATDGLQVAFNTNYVRDNLAVEITTPETWLATDIASGVLNDGRSQEVQVIFDATNLTDGEYEAAIEITSNDPNNFLIEVPVSLTVGETGIQDSSWTAPITIANSADTTQRFELNFGGDHAATDGFDDGIDGLAPPPGLSYYAYFSIAQPPSFLETDIRNWVSPFEAEIDWSLVVTNATGITSEVSWDPADLPQTGGFTLREPQLGIAVDMRTQDRVQFTGSANLVIEYRNAVVSSTVSFDFPQSGWYLVSLPVIPDDKSASAVFPNAVSIFEWNYGSQTYVAVDSVRAGRGYWLFAPNPATIQVTGEPVNQYSTSYVTAGWDMIGAVSAASSITDVPSGSVVAMYSWDPAAQNYAAVNSFVADPMQGYWLMILNVPSTITVENSLLAASNKVRPAVGTQSVASEFSPPLPPNLAVAKEGKNGPAHHVLLQNYPNPFNPETTIQYLLAGNARVQLKIFTLLGHEVRTLVSKQQQAGAHRLVWDGRNHAGVPVESGVYIYTLHIEPSGSGEKSPSYSQSRKLILLR